MEDAVYAVVLADNRTILVVANCHENATSKIEKDYPGVAVEQVYYNSPVPENA